MLRRKEHLLPSAGHATDAKGGGSPLSRFGPAYIAVIFARREREKERERACLVTARRGRPSNGAAHNLYIATYNQRNRDAQGGGCLALNFFPPLSLLRLFG